MYKEKSMPNNKKIKPLSVDDIHSLKVSLQAAVIREAFLKEELKLIEPLIGRLDEYETMITKAYQERQAMGIRQPNKGE